MGVWLFPPYVFIAQNRAEFMATVSRSEKYQPDCLLDSALYGANR